MEGVKLEACHEEAEVLLERLRSYVEAVNNLWATTHECEFHESRCESLPRLEEDMGDAYDRLRDALHSLVRCLTK